MSKGAGKRDARAARERARLYQARQQFHEGTIRRRVRDNVVAGIAGGALILMLLVGQTLYFTAGPGMPTPEPTPTDVETVAPDSPGDITETDVPDPAGTATPDPTPSAEPSASPTP